MALGIVTRLQAYLHPLLLLAVGFYGLLLVLLDAFTFQMKPKDLLDRDIMSDKVFGKVWLRLDERFATSQLETSILALVASASGTVLEVGPGSGSQLPRYNKSKITKIYGVEPNVDLHDALHKTVKQCGLSDIYTIVPCGAEDFQTLARYGIEKGSVDTILSVQVICGLPEPQKTVRGMYELLKPGGQMIVYEHVESHDAVSHFVQGIYNVVWPFSFGGCQLDRPTGAYLMKAGKWSKVDLEPKKEEDDWSVFPTVVGRLVKES